MSLTTRTVRYWHTLRWLKPVQFYGRARLALWRPRSDLAPAPTQRRAVAAWQGCARAASLVAPACLRFLGVQHELAQAQDWNRADWPKLWLYNAHYFDDLVAVDAVARSAWHQGLIERWLEENPPVAGMGWEPYPLSLRIVNWLKWAAAGNELSLAARHSVAVQARCLSQRLEVHLLGNHLWANAKALVFAGAAHEGVEAAAWLRLGLAMVERELHAQILSDGGHFERSPMYHAIVLEDLLDLLQLARIHPGHWTAPARVAHWRALAAHMLDWLRAMTHPDGHIAQFNDAALEIAPNFAALRDYAGQLRVTCDTNPMPALKTLSDSGYFRLACGPAVLIADAGAIGPDHQPGHAHADTLSFELSLHGRRVLVNAGTSTYESGRLRQWQRGTAAHNSVIVDGQDSSEVWAAFRVARRARPQSIRWHEEIDALTLEAAHDGYRRLPGKVTPWRRWQLAPTGLRVTDRFEGKASDARARYRFAPGIAIQATAVDHGCIAMPDATLVWRATGARGSRVVDEHWYPGFGQEHPCQVLELDLGPGETVFELAWDA